MNPGCISVSETVVNQRQLRISGVNHGALDTMQGKEKIQIPTRTNKEKLSVLLLSDAPDDG